MADDERLEAVRQEWLRRVEAEYGSAALTHHLTSWSLSIAGAVRVDPDGAYPSSMTSWRTRS